jgi:hypothetical protein
MSKKRCAVSYEGGVWEVLFGSDTEYRSIIFSTQAQALLSANEWTWSERHKGHDVDLLLPAVMTASERKPTEGVPPS